MAKREKKGTTNAGASGPATGSGGSSPSLAKAGNPRLAAALQTFKRGDYVRARALLAPLAEDASLAEGERKDVTALLAATRLDSALPRTALASLALLVFAVVLTSVFQP